MVFLIQGVQIKRLPFDKVRWVNEEEDGLCLEALNEIYSITARHVNAISVFGNLLTPVPKLWFIEPRIELPFACLLHTTNRTPVHNDPGPIASVEEERRESPTETRHATALSVHVSLTTPFSHTHTRL
ncbi:MAG: hypothetical protein WBD63_05800 [Phycisphaerae bacterium]|nr:hypothetical protein [Phycisphaerae bacterium]